MKKIALFCGSRFDKEHRYVESVKQGVSLLAKKYEVIFGGSNTGYMKLVADSVKSVDGYLIGIMPEFLKDKELAYARLDELIETKDMNDRKLALFDKADGFIALPGGLGTFEEVIDLLSWLQLGLYKKPVGFFNPNNFFYHLIALIDEKIEEGFIEPSLRELFFISDNMEELLEMIKQADIENQESWDLYDINRKPLASTILRSHAHLMREGQYHIVIFLLIQDKNGNYLLQQRSKEKETYSLLWDFSVGGSALAFENSVEAIIRETKEELGLEINESDIELIKTFVDEESKCFIDVYNYEIEDLDLELLNIPNEEVAQVKWFNKQEIIDLSDEFIGTEWKWEIIK